MIINRQSSKLQAAEMKFLRSALQKNKKDKIRNDRKREEMRVEKKFGLKNKRDEGAMVWTCAKKGREQNCKKMVG